jgi:hypothetical protein
MPVADVKSVVAASDSDSRNRLIVEHLDRLELELAQTRSAVEELRNLLERPEPAEPIEHRTVPPTSAVGIQQTVDRDDIFTSWQGALGELQATVQAQRLQATGTSGGLYASELFQHGRGAATVFIPAEGSVKAVGRVVPLIIPGMELAITPPRLTGHRPHLRKPGRLRDEARNQRRRPSARVLPRRLPRYRRPG